MIYILMRNATDYDECDEMIFASVSKEVIERKHEEIIKNHRILQRFAKMVQSDKELWWKNNPPPPSPDYKNLPLRPLVWNGSWQNAYDIEHREECCKHNEKFLEFDKHLIQQLKENYCWAPELIPELDNIFSYLYDRSYSVKEVESD